jgi:hypothetical protein
MRKKEGTRDFLKNRSESTSTVGELRKIDFVGIATWTGLGWDANGVSDLSRCPDGLRSAAGGAGSQYFARYVGSRRVDTHLIRHAIIYSPQS